MALFFFQAALRYEMKEEVVSIGGVCVRVGCSVVSTLGTVAKLNKYCCSRLE